MKTTLALLLALTMLLTPMGPGLQSQEKAQAKVQVALLLDTSGSMDGLIDQAKSQLWKVVNELATAKYEGERPVLEIALYEYGNDNLKARDGYIKQIVKLTTDLDLISEKLFALTTNGGEEYCGWVIRSATKQLKWSKSNEDLKMIFIAGNEPFNQGSVDYKKTVRDAIANGIIVNTIFCGNYDEGVTTSWKDGSDLADGKYLNINQNQAIVHVETPYDEEILDLNTKLNTTYVRYGSYGMANKERQEEQDKNARFMGTESLVNRAVSKSQAAYSNSHWDLVDAMDEDEGALEKVKKDELPEELKNMKPEELKKYIEDKKKERDDLQNKIKELDKKRNDYVTLKLKENAADNTLDAALIKTIRKQAVDKNFIFDK